MILGAVLAGGGATRFGSDKALAVIEGRTLISRAVDALSGWCERVVVVGRAEAPAPTLPDWPRADMGPLGGLAAALRHALDEDYEAVLSCGVDVVGLPRDLPALLSPAPACIDSLPVVGLWPSAQAARVVEAMLLDPAARHSVYGFAEAIGARRVAAPQGLINVNTPQDLAAWMPPAA